MNDDTTKEVCVSTIYISISCWPCEWFLYRRTRHYEGPDIVDRWQLGCFVVERVRRGMVP